MRLAAKALLILALGAGPVVHTGYAVRYDPGVMERVAARRHIAPAPCMVAWTYARDADIGETWLRIVGPTGALECLVIDLPQKRDRPGLVERDVEVELGYPSRWICGKGWTGRARDCPVRVWVIPNE